MSDRPIRRYLSDDIRRRSAVRPTRVVARTPLRLARGRRGTKAGNVVPGIPPDVQTEPAHDERPTTTAEQDAGADRPTPQQIADRVYQLLRRERRVERERMGR